MKKTNKQKPLCLFVSDTSGSTGTGDLKWNFLDCFKKMADKLDMGEMASFNNANLKMKTQENTCWPKRSLSRRSKQSEIS